MTVEHRTVVSLKAQLSKFSEGAGVPNKPIVKKGDEITVGQPLGEISDKDLGAIIHAPIAGIVAEVTDDLIILTRQA